MRRAEGHPLRILLWHVHGAWTSSFVRGRPEYLLPLSSEGGPWGRGRCDRAWPSARETSPDELRNAAVDVVVLRRPEEIELTERWTGRRPGRDLPTVVEHNTPTGDVPRTRRPLADQDEIPLVQVTHFHHLMWESGPAPATVIEHGVVDPGERYTGEEPAVGLVMNEPARRGRAVGTDLLPASMHLGMPVVAVASTETTRAVPPEAGVVSADVHELVRAVRDLIADPELAHRMGKQAREHALAGYALDAFRRNWDDQLGQMTTGGRA